jgi:CO/xanthine dehydrogenase Mo-binding subunit
MDWENKWHPAGTKILDNGNYHGMGFMFTHEWDDTRGTGAAGVMVETDGSVSIISCRMDIGVNAESTYCDVVAETLGVSRDIVISGLSMTLACS